MRRHPLLVACIAALALAGCKPPATDTAATASVSTAPAETQIPASSDYAVVPLKADLSGFDENGKRMIALLVQAAQVMDDLYWQQSWDGDRAALLQRAPDAGTRDLVALNFGPWDRLNEDKPLLEGIGPRPPGATFYPADMTTQEFEQADLADKASWYTLLRRDANGKLVTVPYHVAYKADLERAAGLLREAAKLSADASFASYLELRAKALLDDDFQASDLAWMDMKSNPVDIVIGPIESYEDALFGYKTAYEGIVLVKDQEWSQRLTRFA